jgi:hypothetical protein
MQNQLFQIPVFPQMLNRDLVEQQEQRVLGPTTLYQAQYQMSDLPCKCSLVSGGAYRCVANKCEPTLEICAKPDSFFIQTINNYIVDVQSESQGKEYCITT